MGPPLKAKIKKGSDWELALVDTCRGGAASTSYYKCGGEIHSILNKVVKGIAAYHLLHHLALAAMEMEKQPCNSWPAAANNLVNNPLALCVNSLEYLC